MIWHHLNLIRSFGKLKLNPDKADFIITGDKHTRESLVPKFPVIPSTEGCLPFIFKERMTRKVVLYIEAPVNFKMGILISAWILMQQK